MYSHSSNLYDVIIAGAGPVGFVAWVSDSEEPNSELLVQILTQWFG